MDEAIEILTKLLIKEHMTNKGNQKKYVLTKLELYQFCIKLLKTINRYNY